MLSDWTNYENWEAAGAQEAVARSTLLWRSALDEYQEPFLEDAVYEELEAYVAKRKEQIGTGDPWRGGPRALVPRVGIFERLHQAITSTFRP